MTFLAYRKKREEPWLPEQHGVGRKQAQIKLREHIGANQYNKRAIFPKNAEMREEGVRDDETISHCTNDAVEGCALYSKKTQIARN
ncbi:hypothetical protein [Uliginosibacterium aquaticum]|uniref:Uncharacterized protein n=1 Tax=Uliginosibacterium aquaticum TaxID=2731212 RepID=A0ABX2IHU1_9RHOO|nr:hypothetical protein [Uliginosibacterium aquaticum]NSL56386.1 hypothetical protein [Uliginosibacterium aquaticum]